MPLTESGCKYAAVSVEIVAIDAAQQTVTFHTDARLTTATNASPEEDRRLLGQFTCAQSELWMPPAIWPKAPPVPEASVPLQVGATGVLYLSNTALPKGGTSASGACQIRGWYPDARPAPGLDDEQVVGFKWPDCRPSDDWFPLKLKPESVKVMALANGKLETVDLRDPALAQPDQDLVWTGASPVTLQLTPGGLQRFGIAAAAPQALQAWPVRIDVTAVALSNTGAVLSSSKSVDLRHQKHAARRQHLSWTAADPTVTARLTTSGHVLFNIGPEDVKAALRRMLAAFRASPDLEAAYRIIQVARDAIEECHHGSMQFGTDEPFGRTDELRRLVTRFIEGDPPDAP